MGFAVMRTERHFRNERWIIGMIIGIGVIACVMPVMLRPDHFPSDDAFFYLQVAHNMAIGLGSTFNTIIPTNGYHPLWQWMCAGVAYLSGGDKIVTLYAVCLLNVLLFLGIVYYLHRINRDFLRIRYWYVAIPLLTIYYLCIGLYGSEAALHGYVLCATAYYLLHTLRNPVLSNWQLLSLGCLFGLLFLARLDALFMILAMGSAILFTFRHLGFGTLLRYCIVMVTSFFVITAPYLLWNYLTFGHLGPISGAIKSSFPHITAKIGSLHIIGISATIASVIGIIRGFGRKKAGKHFHFHFIISTGAILLAMYVFLFTDHVTKWAWYYVPGTIMIAILCAELADYLTVRILHFKKAIIVTTCTVLMLIGALRTWSEYATIDPIGYNLFKFSGASSVKPEMDIAMWLKANLPAHTRIYMYDWPGYVAYYSDMDVLPVDGLIGDYDYNNELRDIGVVQYLINKDIQYWLGPTIYYPQRRVGYTNTVRADGTQTIQIYAPLYNVEAGSFSITPAQQLVDFTKTFARPFMHEVGLWQISP